MTPYSMCPWRKPVRHPVTPDAYGQMAYSIAPYPGELRQILARATAVKFLAPDHHSFSRWASMTGSRRGRNQVGDRTIGNGISSISRVQLLLITVGILAGLIAAWPWDWFLWALHQPATVPYWVGGC